MVKKKKSKGKSKGGFFGVAIALIIVLVAVYVGYRIEPGNTETPTGQVTGETETTVDPNIVLVTVNGEVITQANLDERYNELPPNIQAYVSKDSYLEELIDETLLNAEADKFGIEISDEEVDAEIDKIGVEQGLTREEMDSILQQQGQSLETFKEDLAAQLRLQKLFDEVVPVENVSEEEIMDAYEQLNPVTVRHILVSLEQNETDEELASRAQEVVDEISDDRSNFCELVIANTVDTASMNTCGEYQVYVGSNFVPEFEEAALNMEVDEVRIVQTQFGYHIIWKVENTPLEDVRENIIQTLQLGSSRDSLTKYLDDLRASAEVVYGDETEDFNAIFEEEMTEIPVIEEEVVLEIPEEEVVEILEETPEEEVLEEVVEEVPEEVVVEIPEEEVLEEVVEEVPEVVEEPEVIMEEPEYVDIDEVVVDDTLLSCLSDVTLYGAYWDSQTKKQLQIFEGEVPFYVECFQPGSYRTKNAVCEDVRAFPTWEIDGQMYIGYLSLNSLRGITGC